MQKKTEFIIDFMKGRFSTDDFEDFSVYLGKELGFDGPNPRTIKLIIVDAPTLFKTDSSHTMEPPIAQLTPYCTPDTLLAVAIKNEIQVYLVFVLFFFVVKIL
jgi:hypothetical protein